jgi:hypothetical protein
MFRSGLFALVLLTPLALACSFGDIYNGCGSHGTEDLVPGDLVGTWSGTDAGTLTLNSDGTFTASELRQKDADPRLLTGRGTWSMNQASTSDTERVADVSDVPLTFANPDGTKTAWNRIDVNHDIRPVRELRYLYGPPESCDLRTLVKQ